MKLMRWCLPVISRNGWTRSFLNRPSGSANVPSNGNVGGGVVGRLGKFLNGWTKSFLPRPHLRIEDAFEQIGNMVQFEVI